MEKINRQLNEKEYLQYIEQWKTENKELIESGKCKKIFLENLPKWEKDEGNGHIGSINWIKSKNNIVHFIFNTIEGELEITNYINRAMNYDEKKIYSDALTKCSLDSVLRLITSDFKIKIGHIINDDKRNLTITDKEIRPRYKKDGSFKCNEKWYKYTCNKCGWTEGWIVESALLSKRKLGCLCCRGLIVVEGINDIPTTAPWMVKYFQGGYEEAKLYTKYGGGNTNNPRGNIYPVCPDCGRVGKISTSIYNIFKHEGFGCSCNDGMSYPNKFAFNALEQLNIDFKNEYSPKWIGKRKYDFYFKLNYKKYILEMDGGFHYQDNPLSGQTKEESKAIDDYKDGQAKLHNIEVIRIDCNYLNLENRFEYIKQNMLNNKELNKLFNLSNIDWDKCNEFALSNRIKEVCELWNKEINSTIKIAEILKMNRGRVINYLKQGTIIGWCNYNAKEETIKGSSYSGKLKRKKVIMLTLENKFIKIFKSNKDIQENSEELFGIKLRHEGVSSVARGKRNQYKGYHFKYVENLTYEEYVKYDIENKLRELKQVIQK